MEWLIELAGDQFDLEDLALRFTSPSMRVSKKQDKHVLESNAFVSFSTADEVFEAGRILIERINGIARINIPGFQNCSISSVIEIHDDGTSNYYVRPAPAVIRPRGHLAIQVIHADGTIEIPGVENLDQWNVLATHEGNKYFDLAIKLLYSNEPTWYDLYKVYELIPETHIKDHKELKRFKQTANRYRHGDPQKYKPHDKPMTIRDAKDFILNLMKEWGNELLQKNSGL